MPNSSTAALAADLPFRAAGRAVNLGGVAFTATCLAMVACLSLTAVERTGVGLAMAAALIVGGELLSRRFRSECFTSGAGTTGSSSDDSGSVLAAHGRSSSASGSPSSDATTRGASFRTAYADQLWFFGTALLAAGYVLAVFFTQATYYLHNLSALSDPYLCWVLEVVLGFAAALQLSSNRILRWF